MARLVPLRLQNQNQVRQGHLGPKAGGWRASPPLPPVSEEPSSPPETKPANPADDDISPLSKLKDWQAVTSLARPAPASAQPAHCAAAAAAEYPTAGAPPARRAATKAAADVARLVQSLLQTAAAAGGTAVATGTAPNSSSGGANSLASSLHALADPAVLALATDCVLAALLAGLQPLLSYSHPDREWVTSGLGALLGPLQQSCQERMRRITLPCDAVLAGVAARFFARVIREAGGGVVADGLLEAAAAYTFDNCRLLNGEVLASILSLLCIARFQPAAPIAFGNRAVGRLLHLHKGKVGVQLSHFATAVEALAQLRCTDGQSASPLVTMAVALTRKLEEGCTHLAPGQLGQLARVMHSVAIIAATTTVQSPILMGATAAWHLLVVRAEAMAQEQAAAGAPVLAAGGPHLGLALSRMWSASRMLMAALSASSAPSFMLPDRLGLASHAAHLDQQQRNSPFGLTSAQRRVLAALSALKVAPSKVSVNQEFLEVFHINVAVRMRLQSSGQQQRIAVLIRDPLRQLLHRCSGRPAGCPAAMGADAAQESLLKAAGWKVVCLDSQSCLSLPVPLLSEELGALMLGEPSSLRFAA